MLVPQSDSLYFAQPLCNGLFERLIGREAKRNTSGSSGAVAQ